MLGRIIRAGSSMWWMAWWPLARLPGPFGPLVVRASYFADPGPTGVPDLRPPPDSGCSTPLRPDGDVGPPKLRGWPWPAPPEDGPGAGGPTSASSIGLAAPA